MNILSSFTVYTAVLHVLILILFSLHTSALGYPGLTTFQQIKGFHLQKQAAGNPTPAASSRRDKNTVLKPLETFLESEWFPCMSRDLHSLSQNLADTQTKVIELEQRIDALQTSAANATTATDHRVDILQSSTENATQAAVSELRRLDHELSQRYVLLNEFAQVSSQQPSKHFQFPQQQPQQQPQRQPQVKAVCNLLFSSPD